MNKNCQQQMKKNASEISDALNICMFNLPKLSLKVSVNMPSIFMQMSTIGLILSDTFNLNDKIHKIENLRLCLFIFICIASVPFLGAGAQFITCKACMKKDYSPAAFLYKIYIFFYLQFCWVH